MKICDEITVYTNADCGRPLGHF